MIKLNRFREKIDYSSKEITLPKGEILYHGTAESFDARSIRTGGYDNIFWTADDKYIALSYIPYLEGVHTSVSGILRTLQSKDDNLSQGFRKSLNYTDQVERLLWKKHREIMDRWTELENKHREFQKKHWSELTDEEIAEWEKVEEELISVQKRSRREDWLASYIIQQLKKLGYTVENKNAPIKLNITTNGEIQPNIPSKGKLLKVIPKRDMKLFNYALGKEGDLTNVEYNHLDTFDKVEKEGYDGIVINDFAQNKYHGNFGHLSVGFFKKALQDLKVSAMAGEFSHPEGEYSKEQ